MQITTNTHSSAIVCRLSFIAVLWPILAVAVSAQVDSNRPGKISDPITKDNLADSLSRLKQGTFHLVDVDRIAKAGARQAIPDLERQFALIPNINKKGKIAIALVKLGEKDGIYWDYLVKEATSAVESDAPSSMDFDANGKAVPGESPELIAWARTHNVETASALEAPLGVFMLGLADDRRAIPLLRRALSSHNYLIATFGAEGLFNLMDKDSIPLIVGACQKAPTDAAFAISQASLLRFDDPQAKSAAKIFAANAAARNGK